MTKLPFSKLPKPEFTRRFGFFFYGDIAAILQAVSSSSSSTATQQRFFRPTNSHTAISAGDSFRPALYRFDKDGNQWKERGAGSVRFLKHKKTEKVHLHAGNDKSCVWHAAEFC
ncbi:putative Ran binding domain, PH-like domain superfamily [Helianthus annuus]|nr:putative Ran binding domain, PH-like domain superfamily [Helianthus annuus]